MPLGSLALAGAGVAGYQLAFFQAVADTGVAVAAIVAIGSGPAFAGLLERFLDGSWPGARWRLATLLATLGVGVLTLASAGDASLSASGIGLALVSGAGYATYTIVAKRLLRNGHEPLAVVTTLVLAEPLTATALGVLVLDEHLGLSGAGGAALILGGLAVLALRRPARLLPAVEPTR